jgi:serine protease Do
MANNKPEIKEYMGQFDDGTYRTGTIRPGKSSSAVLAFLLAAVIFLGGFCSALGLINIHLLKQMAQANQQTTPLSKDTQPSSHWNSGQLADPGLPEPQLPETYHVELKLADSPQYSQDHTSLSGMAAQQIYDSNVQSLVQVQSLTHFGAVQEGVGIVLSQDGFLLVNHHVVESARRIYVQLHDGTLARAKLVGSDSFSDLAVLYIQAEGLIPAVFCNNRTLQVTDPSFAVDSLGTTPNILESTVFTASRILTTKRNTLRLIQTCQGSETGPVFNAFGQIMGFQVGHISHYFESADTIGTGLVIPTDTIRTIVRDLLAQGHVHGRPSLGFEVEAISKVYQQYWQLPGGLLLTQVKESSNAALTGLQEGDILLALDGQPIASRTDLYARLYDLQVGDTVTAVICRDDHKFTVKLTIEEHKAQ